MGKSDGGLLRYRLGSASDQESGAQGQNSWLELYSAFFFPHQKPIHQPTCQSQLTSKLIDGRKRSDENHFPYIGSYMFLYRFLLFCEMILGMLRKPTSPHRTPTGGGSPLIFPWLRMPISSWKRNPCPTTCRGWRMLTPLSCCSPWSMTCRISGRLVGTNWIEFIPRLEEIIARFSTLISTSNLCLTVLSGHSRKTLSKLIFAWWPFFSSVCPKWN